MFAKIKNNQVIAFPYGYDQLQSDNPHTRYSGAIDLIRIFAETEESVLRGCQLVDVICKPEPFVRPFEEAVQASLPTLVGGEWVLDWVITPKHSG